MTVCRKIHQLGHSYVMSWFNGTGSVSGCLPLCGVVVCVLQGDGLEFKRLFVKIKQKLGDIVSNQKILLPIT